MTEMVHGARAARPGDPVLPRWWRSVDSWSIAAVVALCAIGLLLGLAASPPLAERNGHAPFYYVTRAHLPAGLRHRFRQGRGALVLAGLRLGAAVGIPQAAFRRLAAWLMAASAELDGPPGTAMSLGTALMVAGLLPAARFRAGRADFVWLGGDVFRRRRADAAAAGRGRSRAWRRRHGLFPVRPFRPSHRRLPGRDGRSQQPAWLCQQRDPRGRLFRRRGVGEGQVKWSLPDAHTDFIIAVAAEEYGLILVLADHRAVLVIIRAGLLRLMRERDPFIRFAGCTGHRLADSALQAIINMGVAVRLLPAKGMTLPFCQLWRVVDDRRRALRWASCWCFTRDPPAGRYRRSCCPAGCRGERPRAPASDHRGRRHRRAHVPRPGAGRGDAAARLAGDAVRPMRAARAMPGAFPIQVPVRQVASATFARGGRLAKALVPFRIAAGIASTAHAMYRDRPAWWWASAAIPAIPALAAAWLKPPHDPRTERRAGSGEPAFRARVDRGGLRHWPTSLPSGGGQCPYRQSGARRDPRAGRRALHAAGRLADEPSGLRRQPGRAALSDRVPAAVAQLPEDLRTGCAWPSRPGPRISNGSRAYAAASRWRAEVAPFFDDMPRRLTEAQLVIARAGASSWPISRRSGGRRS
jgi:cell division protein FtsW